MTAAEISVADRVQGLLAEAARCRDFAARIGAMDPSHAAAGMVTVLGRAAERPTIMPPNVLALAAPLADFLRGYLPDVAKDSIARAEQCEREALAALQAHVQPNGPSLATLQTVYMLAGSSAGLSDKLVAEHGLTQAQQDRIVEAFVDDHETFCLRDHLPTVGGAE